MLTDGPETVHPLFYVIISFKNIGLLMNVKHIYFVPFGQDAPEKKHNSMIAHLDRLIPAAEAALDGRQLQPVICG